MGVESDLAVGSNFQWQRAVQDAISDCIAAEVPFTSDDLWARLGRAEDEPASQAHVRTLAWVLRDAARTRRIVKTGTIVKGRYAARGSPVAEWKAGHGA